MHKITQKQVRKIGDKLGVNWKEISIDQFTQGIKVELEHAGTIAKYGKSGIDKYEVAASIVLDHLAEYSDYYTRLKQVET